jgi:GT2 family glycosyltransferase
MMDDSSRRGLPQRPPSGAGPEAWQRYADELEAVIAAAEHRADFLQARINQIAGSSAWKVLKKAKNLLDSSPLGSAGKKSRSGKGTVPEKPPFVRGEPLVSILIPFRDGAKWLERCLNSLRAKTAYKNYELILIDNGSSEKATLKILAQEKAKPGVQVLRIDEAFNFARLNNLAAAKARGEFLLFLNNDIEVLQPHWLAAMIERSQQPGVGAVGAKLLYPDGRIQHAGVAMGVDDIAGHVYRLLAEDAPEVSVVRECSAVTAACMMTPRKLFGELGGFNEIDLPIAYNDVDYCLRLREKEYRVIYTPHATLLHHESISRGALNDPRQSAYMCRRWAKAMRDPFYPGGAASLVRAHEKRDDAVIDL